MKKLNCFNIAALYIGIIMGAGFASGRECWQFFGVFGNDGYKGAILVTIGFVAYGFMLTKIARSKNTYDLGKLVSPFDNWLIEGSIGNILALFYYTDLIVMSAAGGSLLNQQFGINKIWGGLIITVLVIATVLGNFARISRVFKYLVPVLFCVAIIMIILIINADYTQSGPTDFEPGHMSPNWLISSLVFLAYNTIAMITMAGNTAVNAKNRINAYLGAIIGGACLGGLILALMRALMTDMTYTASFDMPMLGYSLRLSPIINVIYAIILFGSIYSTGTSCYYGFTTIIPDGKSKSWIIIICSLLAFTLGLLGFTKMIEYLYPTQGYIGSVFLLLIVINFIKVSLKK